MKSLISRVSAVLIALAAFGAGGVALAGELPKFSNCAWPVMQSSEGLGNYLGGPDEQARYWLTPFDRKYQTMEIRGRFPHSRYFSIVAYNGNDRALPASTAGHFYDAMIAPDPGSANPYRQSTSSRRPTGAPVGDAYTIYVTRGKDIPGAANVIKVTEHDAWVYVRIYVPSPVDSLSGTAFTGGVPLPTLKLYEPGKAVPEVMKPCPVDAPEPAQDFYPVRAINKFSDVRALLQHFFPVGVDLNQASDHDEVLADDRIWFAPPWNPPMLLMPNPDNKYLVALPGPYQKGRIIVMRTRLPNVSAKGGAMPDMRYWSICNTDFELPVSSVACLYDGSVMSQQGWLTTVISDDVSRPAWLPAPTAWMPWGDSQYPKWLFYRHMIPVHSDADYDDPAMFPYAIQKVVAGCWRGKTNPDPVLGKLECNHPDAVLDFTFPNLPPRSTFTNPGISTQKLMGDYYPVAVWCDKYAFEHGGWQACQVASAAGHP